ncbi:thiamine pyrophosphate-dependent dehydrogenase E1 component subunit alpha [Chloroflexota bacterium]
MPIPKEKLIDMFRTMVRIRRFEEAVFTKFAEGELPGWVHMYIGEEAIAAGVCAVLRADDYITSTHRGHGHIIAKGGGTDRMMAELYGKKTGYCKGKGGSMHIADVNLGILGANGIVGAGITIATGAALSAKLRGTDQVALCFFGDGAANTTRFHEGINFASIRKLPAIYLCENNQYGEYFHVSKSMNIANIADRGVSYGIPGIVVDGNDVIAIYEKVNEAVARARKGEGPTLIECKTCRQHGHFEGDAEIYRTKEEVEECKKRDPIPRFKKQLIEMKILTEKETDEIDKAAIKEIDDAVKFAKRSPDPDPMETLEDLYV